MGRIGIRPVVIVMIEVMARRIQVVILGEDDRLKLRGVL
jgi:hypothetical protein